MSCINDLVPEKCGKATYLTILLTKNLTLELALDRCNMGMFWIGKVASWASKYDVGLNSACANVDQGSSVYACKTLRSSPQLYKWNFFIVPAKCLQTSPPTSKEEFP
jgi:hypothetical protein